MNIKVYPSNNSIRSELEYIEDIEFVDSPEAADLVVEETTAEHLQPLWRALQSGRPALRRVYEKVLTEHIGAR